MNAFDQDGGVEDLKATLAAPPPHDGGHPPPRPEGHGRGGGGADSNVNISYYGVGLGGLLDEVSNLRAPLLRIAELDSFFPPEGRAKVVAALQDNPYARTYCVSRRGPRLRPGERHAMAGPQRNHRQRSQRRGGGGGARLRFARLDTSVRRHSQKAYRCGNGSDCCRGRPVTVAAALGAERGA